MTSGTIARAGQRPVPAITRFADLGPALALVAVAVAYYLAPGTLLSVLLLAVLVYLISLRSDLAVTLIPLAVPLYMLPKHLHLVRNLEFSLGETVIVLCAIVVLIQQIKSAKSRPAGVSLVRHFVPASPFEWPALAFLLATALATVTAHFHTVALRQFREVVLEPLLFFWLILQRVQGPWGAVRLVLAVVIAGVVVAVLGVGQILFRPQDMAVAQFVAGAPHLVRAVYGNENNLALLLDRAIPMALALALLPGWLRLAFAGTSTESRDRGIASNSNASGDDLGLPGRIQRYTQLALVLASLLMLYVLYRTDSRGGEAAIAVCLGVLFVYWQRHHPRVLAGTAALVVIVALVARHRIANAISSGHGLATDARVSVWQSALRMLRDHPIFGVGPDNFLYYYSNDAHCAPGHIAAYYYRQTNDKGVPVNFERCINHPHNLFLDLWLSTGVLGLLAGLALLVVFAVVGIRAFRRADVLWQGSLLAALIGMLALVVHGQVDNSYFLPDLAVIFWLCFGVVALWSRQTPEPG